MLRLRRVPGSAVRDGQECRRQVAQFALPLPPPKEDSEGKGEFVFPGARAVLRGMGGDVTVHGISGLVRRSHGIPARGCRSALAHVIGDKAEAAYRRGTALEKRRKPAFALAFVAGIGVRVRTSAGEQPLDVGRRSSLRALRPCAVVWPGTCSTVERADRLPPPCHADLLSIVLSLCSASLDSEVFSTRGL